MFNIIYFGIPGMYNRHIKSRLHLTVIGLSLTYIIDTYDKRDDML